MFATTLQRAAGVLAAAVLILPVGRAGAVVGAPTFVRVFMGPGLAAMYPVDLAASGKYYYAVDPGRYRVLAIDRQTLAITYQVGGRKSSLPGQLAAARAITRDSAGNIYVADTPNNRIQKYDFKLQFIKKWGVRGSGPGQFNQVYGVEAGTGLASGGESVEVIYAVDNAGRVQRFDTDGNYIGEFPGAAALLDHPRMIAVHPVTNNVYVVSARDREVVVFSPAGNMLFRFGGGGSGPGQFSGDPRGIAIDSAGNVFVTDANNQRVQVFDSLGVYLRQIGSGGSGPGQFTAPRGLITTPDGRLAVTDEWDYSLKEFRTSGTFIRKILGTPPPADGVNSPRGLSVDGAGRVFTVDWWNNRVHRKNADLTGHITWGFRGTKTQPGSINFAWGIAVQPGTGRVFVANRESHEIEVFSGDGTFLTRWGIRGTADGNFQFPQGVAFAPDGKLWVTDSANGRVQAFSISGTGAGTFVSKSGQPGAVAAGNLDVPAGISVGSDGAVWVADTGNSRIQRFKAGTWTAYTGPTTKAFKVPWGVRVGPDGNVWVADSGNNRLVKISAATGDALVTATGPDMGAGNLASPYDIVFGAGGKMYVSDVWNNRVLELAI